jgi:molecular chaperone GrpE
VVAKYLTMRIFNFLKKTPKDMASKAEKNGTETETATVKKKTAKRTPKKEKVLNEKIELLQQELGELKDKQLRLLAEFENYKKRTSKERIELFKTAGQDIVTDLLPVIDDFDRGEELLEKSTDVESIKVGIKLISGKLKNILEQKGLTEMDTKEVVFDPDFHEAITEIPAASEDMKGKVVDVVQKGYLLNEKIIRHARVVVGK